MGKRRHTAEQSISKLREAEVLQSKGMAMERGFGSLDVRECVHVFCRDPVCQRNAKGPPLTRKTFGCKSGQDTSACLGVSVPASPSAFAAAT